MNASVNELKDRLGLFLSDPQTEHEFRAWFALKLRDVHKENDPEAERFAHEVQRAFSDAQLGFYTPGELKEVLQRLAKPEALEISASVGQGTTVVLRYLSGGQYQVSPEEAEAQGLFLRAEFDGSGAGAFALDHAQGVLHMATLPATGMVEPGTLLFPKPPESSNSLSGYTFVDLRT